MVCAMPVFGLINYYVSVELESEYFLIVKDLRYMYLKIYTYDICVHI